MKKFYGLRGLKLNIAIAVVAGTDFALFGYGKLHPCHDHAAQLVTELQIKA
jgi:hypothetical protein